MYGRAAADWGHDYLLAQADVIYLAEESGDRAGYDLSWLGDTNADGIDDILISAYQGRQEQTVAGKAHVVYGGQVNATPLATLFTPDTPSGQSREWHLFSNVYEDGDGWADLAQVQMILGRAVDDPERLEVMYDVAGNGLYLRAADGVNWLGPCTPGAETSLRSSVAILGCWHSRAFDNGDTKLRVDVWARFFLMVDQPRDLSAYLRAVDQAGGDSGFVQLGTWALQPKID